MEQHTIPSTPKLDSLTPRQIVEELDRYVIGQKDAKRMVAIALRNRWRRQQLSPELREEIVPKNIIMIGPTGVGKTEISRRVSKLADAPFIKIEASKFTEVGYVGRDVESLIRDLTDISVNQVKTVHLETVQHKAEEMAEERVLDILLPPAPSTSTIKPSDENDISDTSSTQKPTPQESTREKLRTQLRKGTLNERMIEIEVKERGGLPIGIISNIGGMEDMENNLREMLGGMMPGKKKDRRMKISEALKFLVHEEAQKLIDMEEVTKEAISRTEQSGIVFLDEIDKIAGKEKHQGPDISREGVQRDLLPIVEGCTVNTKHGLVKSDHILFIAAGAFHTAKPSDLIPELQGRFPIRVELESLTEEDFYRILTEPDNALIKQYTALLGTEDVHLKFEDDAIREIARMSAHVNERTENIGARRLQTVLEKLLESISFDAPDMKNQKHNIDAAYVQDKLKDIIENEDLSRYIL